jgi:hypothetical protein
MSEDAYAQLRKEAYEIVERSFLSIMSAGKRMPNEREKAMLRVAADSVLSAAKRYFATQLKMMTVNKVTGAHND